MIRYPEAALARIESEVDSLIPNWQERARERTERFRTAGEFRETSSIWSEVKPVFMRLQRNKCIYCETKLEGGALGNIQHDLEHFRPKRGVEAWPPAGASLAYLFETGEAFAQGYYLLAYHLGNYAAACKTCNSPLKASYFPIAATRIAGKDHPHEYAAERPLLVYPLGTQDEDPEKLITFEGVEAVPAPAVTDVFRWRRARVMIDFFALNRDGLQEDRARVLLATWLAYEKAQSGDKDAEELLDIFCAAGAPHASCARCFRRVIKDDPQAARRFFRRAVEILRSISL